MKVYIVEAGQYSDYHICCVCLSRRVASAVAKKHNRLNPWADAHVRVHDVVRDIGDIRPRKIFVVSFNDKGEVIERTFDYAWPWDSSYEAPDKETEGGPNQYRSFRSHDAAIKARQEYGQMVDAYAKQA